MANVLFDCFSKSNSRHSKPSRLSPGVCSNCLYLSVVNRIDGGVCLAFLPRHGVPKGTNNSGLPRMCGDESPDDPRKSENVIQSFLIRHPSAHCVTGDVSGSLSRNGY